MSMPRSRRIIARIDLLFALAVMLAVCGSAQAKQSDKNQPIQLNAQHLVGSQRNGKLVVSGNVRLDQGTFHADGSKATGYTDPNDSSQWQRVVLTGAPAHFRQTQDSGAVVRGQAQTLDYQVSENTVILTGDATVIQEGRGEFHGAKLVYDTDTGEIEGSAAPGGSVHITLQPKKQPASAQPAPTSAPPAASSAAPASMPASASTTALSPAPTGTH